MYDSLLFKLTQLMYVYIYLIKLVYIMCKLILSDVMPRLLHTYVAIGDGESALHFDLKPTIVWKRPWYLRDYSYF